MLKLIIADIFSCYWLLLYPPLMLCFLLIRCRQLQIISCFQFISTYFRVSGHDANSTDLCYWKTDIGIEASFVMVAFVSIIYSLVESSVSLFLAQSRLNLL